jgi:uncharacterized iron-regulated membrane protein
MNNGRSTKLLSNRRTKPNRGIVLIVLIMIVSVSLTLFGVWARQVVREQNRLSIRQWRQQAVRLAEAGVQRAIVRRSADSQYAEETWSVPAEQLDKSHAAEVRIHVVPNLGANTLRYEATAEFPAGAVRRVRITKSSDFPKPSSG